MTGAYRRRKIQGRHVVLIGTTCFHSTGISSIRPTMTNLRTSPFAFVMLLLRKVIIPNPLHCDLATVYKTYFHPLFKGYCTSNTATSVTQTCNFFYKPVLFFFSNSRSVTQSCKYFDKPFFFLFQTSLFFFFTC